MRDKVSDFIRSRYILKMIILIDAIIRFSWGLLQDMPFLR